MKKQLLLPALLLICSAGIHAQLRIGAKAGVNISNEQYSNTAVYSTSSHTFLTGGLMLRYPMKKKIAFESGLYFSPEGTDEEYKSGNNTITGVVKITRLNLPVLFQYRFAGSFYAETGPQIGLVISAKGKYSTGSYDFKEATKSSLVSWVFGAGYEPASVLEGLGFNFTVAPGLQSINSRVVNGGKITASTFCFRVFYLLPAKAKK